MSIDEQSFYTKLVAANFDAKKIKKNLSIHGNLTIQSQSALTELPEGLQVYGTLDAAGCWKLKSLPKGIKVNGDLRLEGCKGLKSLPEGLTVSSLILCDCTGLTSLPKNLKVNHTLNIEGCTGLTSLPEGLDFGWNLFMENCPKLERVPKGLIIRRDLHIDRFIEGMESWKLGYQEQDRKYGKLGFRGQRVPVSLLDKSITVEEFRKLDSEQRRVAILRMGVEWLVKQTKPELLDIDDHPVNGHRALLRVDMAQTLNRVRLDRYCMLVCGDPSTGRVYYMEVPPKTKTCQEADQYLNRGLDQKRQVGRT